MRDVIKTAGRAGEISMVGYDGVALIPVVFLTDYQTRQPPGEQHLW
jgi:hypothetical protein